MRAASVSALAGLTPEDYQRAALHAEARTWVEKNCYVDIWIGLLHALGLEPVAVMPFTLAIDFEGDQWTFFKPPHNELRDLYGIDVQELNVWRPLIDHALEHLSAGTFISTEADAYWLPDTSGTDYRNQHTKTTIVLVSVDLDREEATYFHNAGFYRLQGEDFRQLLRIGAPHDPQFMPFFAETIRVDRLRRHDTATLSRLAWPLLSRHLSWRPRSNPIERFAQRFDQDLPLLQERGLAHYHAWAFACLRQLGAAFELASQHLLWQEAQGHAGLSEAAQAFQQIAEGNKALILKAARAVNAKRALDAAPLFSDMALAWSRGMESLERALA